MRKYIGVFVAVMVVAFALGGCIGPGDGIVNLPPEAVIMYEQSGFTFTFTAAGSTDSDGIIDQALCNWWFGDGETSAGMTVGHTYDSPGAYTVRLGVVDNDGARDETTRIVVVEVPTYDPVAAFYCYPQSIQTGASVAFNGKKSWDRDGSIVWGRWYFGDGTPVLEGAWTVVVYGCDGIPERFSVMREVAHVFTDPGNFTITLTVWDDDGNSDITQRVIVVHE